MTAPSSTCRASHDDGLGGADRHRERARRRAHRHELRGECARSRQPCERVDRPRGEPRLRNIGGATPGKLDMATLGQPAKYTCCFAENTPRAPGPRCTASAGSSRATAR